MRYRAAARDDSGVIEFLEQHIAVNPRHGFDLIYDSARHQGKPWGKTVMWRVTVTSSSICPDAERSDCPRASSGPWTARTKSAPIYQPDKE